MNEPINTTAAGIATATTEEFRKARASCALSGTGVELTIYTPIGELPVRRVVSLALSPAAADELARSLASYATIAREHMPNADRYATDDEIRALGHSDDYARGYRDLATGHDADPPHGDRRARTSYLSGYSAAASVRL